MSTSTAMLHQPTSILLRFVPFAASFAKASRSAFQAFPLGSFPATRDNVRRHQHHEPREM